MADNEDVRAGRLGDIQVRKNSVVVRGRIMGYSGSLGKVTRFKEEDPMENMTQPMSIVGNTLLKIVRRDKVFDFVCRWLIEVKVKSPRIICFPFTRL